MRTTWQKQYRRYGAIRRNEEDTGRGLQVYHAHRWDTERPQFCELFARVALRQLPSYVYHSASESHDHSFSGRANSSKVGDRGDGSTDSTDAIVQGCAALPMDRVGANSCSGRPQFCGKSRCAGYDRVRGIDYDIVGNLDDISFEKEYFEFLMRKFAENPRLGVAGTTC